MTQVPNIYRIDKKHRLLRDLTETLPLIKKIIRTYYQKNELKLEDALDQITSFVKEDFTYYLYHYHTQEKDSDWADFLPEELTGDKQFEQTKVSLVLFIDTEFELYAVIGGNAFSIIINFIDHSFGLNTYDRIVEPDLDELNSIRSRGMTGQMVATSEQFRDEYRLINFTKFGKIPQEIHVKLAPKTTSTYFEFLKSKPIERTHIIVGKGFKINKAIEFLQLHRIMKELVIIASLSPSDYLSSYKQISNTEYIEKNLRPVLINKLYNSIPFVMGTDRDPVNRFDFDFCNPNKVEAFYEAEEYVLKEKDPEKGPVIFATVADRREIYRSVIARALDVMDSYDQFQFMVFIQGVRVLSYKDKKKTGASMFLFHISAEFNIHGQAIFLLDNKWYQLKDLFLKELRINTQHILKTYKAPAGLLPFKWDKTLVKTEKEYNLSYKGMANYLVLDTLIVDGVELCDILHFDDNNLYLIHVKYGFGSQIRELTNQIVISARRLRESIGSDKLLLDKVYDKLAAIDHAGHLSKEEFKGLFEKTITYVLAITSHLKEDLVIEDHIDRYSSNIARFSLIQCSGDMRNNYYDLMTCQIPRV